MVPPVDRSVAELTEGYVGLVDVGAFVAEDERRLAAGRPTFRVGVVSDPALSLGVSQSKSRHESVAAQARGWAVVRRSTGGVGLYHAPGDLVWSWVLPRTDRRIGRDYPRAFARLGEAVTQFLSELGVSAVWAPAASAVSSYCLASGFGATLQVDGRAVAGAAQHATRAALLHHGVVCVCLDPAAIAEVFDAPRDAIVRYLTGLRTLGVGSASPELARTLAGHFERFVAGPLP